MPRGARRRWGDGTALHGSNEVLRWRVPHFGFDPLRFSIVEELEVTGGCGGGARGHDGLTEGGGARPAVRKVCRLDSVEGTTLLCDLCDEGNFVVRVGVEAVDGDDHLGQHGR